MFPFLIYSYIFTIIRQHFWRTLEGSLWNVEMYSVQNRIVLHRWESSILGVDGHRVSGTSSQSANDCILQEIWQTISGPSFVRLRWKSSEHVENPEAARIVCQTRKRRSESEVVTSSDLTSIPVPDASCLAVADRAHLLPQLEGASPTHDSAASCSSSLQPNSPRSIPLMSLPVIVLLIVVYAEDLLYIPNPACLQVICLL